MSSSTKKSVDDLDTKKVCIASLGSNTDSSHSIGQARLLLQAWCPNIQFSSPEWTTPIGMTNPALFLNQVACFATSLPVEEVRAYFKQIEAKLGRDRSQKYWIHLDLDLLQYGEEQFKPKDWTFAHVQAGIHELKNRQHMKFIGIIPARYASTRFPAKPLALLGGQPVIQRVYEQVASILDEVYVATDDERIKTVVKDFAAQVVMTSPHHKSGTDRCYEAVQKVGGAFDVVINIQGDEPFIQKSQIEALKSCFLTDSLTDIATLVKPYLAHQSLAELENPNTPKVVVGADHTALYFSRSVIPYLRNTPKEEWLQSHTYYKHIGLYAYRTKVLGELTRLEQSPLELAESLEQLRWLENGYRIKVAETSLETIGIDTPADLARAEVFLAEQIKKGKLNGE